MRPLLYRTSLVAFALLGVAVLAANAQSSRKKVPANLKQTSTQAEQEARVAKMLSQMTLEEKVDMLAGTGMGTRPLPRLGIPAFNMTDGPGGVRTPAPSTAFPGGIGLAATWNPALAEQMGVQIGRDARSRGDHFLLGPGVNLYRSPRNGRNFEYFGEDPFLGARISVGYIQGVQSQRVSATIKHFLGNNSEFARNASDTIVDERTLHELYLPMFEAAVKEAHVGAIMDSYNLTNGAYMTQNGYFNTEVAKNQWKFPGIMMSDWFATHDAIGAVNGGMDLEMPFGQFLNRRNLLPALEAGKISQSTIDDKVRRILRTAVRFGWLDQEQRDSTIPQYNQEGRQTALEGARQGIVLLKNANNLLPLDKTRIKTVAVIGTNAYPAVVSAGGSGNVKPFSGVSVLTGISDLIGTHGTVTYHQGIPSLVQMARMTRFTIRPERDSKPGVIMEQFDNPSLTGTPTATHPERSINSGRSFFASIGDDSGPPDMEGFANSAPPKPSSTRWTGFYTPQSAGTHTLFVETTDNFRLLVDDELVIDDSRILKAMVNSARLELTAAPHKIVLESYKLTPMGQPFVRMGVVAESDVVSAEAKALAAQADAVVVAVGFNSETELEGSDREFQLPPGQDALIKAIAAVNKNVVVVVNSGGSVDVRPWIDSVSGVVAAWYPGQEGGKALAEILFGEINPSGRLPISWEHSPEDNPAYKTYEFTAAGTNKIEYKEGIFVGYRGYEHNRIKPQFPFGYGLSYTTFRYGNLTVKPLGNSQSAEARYEIAFDVTNTGKRAGADVVQVYVADNHAKVPRTAKELKGFERVELRPGQNRHVRVILTGRAFTYYDVNSKQWHADAGDFEILIGRSAEEIELRGKITLSSPLDIPVGN